MYKQTLHRKHYHGKLNQRKLLLRRMYSQLPASLGEALSLIARLRERVLVSPSRDHLENIADKSAASMIEKT